MWRSDRALFLLLMFLLPLASRGQKFELTAEGLRSSAGTTADFIEYASLEKSDAEMYEYCAHKLGYEADFFAYTTNPIPATRTITVDGYMNGAHLLIFGKTEISFQLLLEFGNAKVKVTPSLTKSNGKPLNYGLLFSKKGSVRVPVTKNKIEAEINGLIEKILKGVVEIR